jgi:hypothetical protein
VCLVCFWDLLVELVGELVDLVLHALLGLLTLMVYVEDLPVEVIGCISHF